MKRWCLRLILLLLFVLALVFAFANSLVQSYIDSHRGDFEALAGEALGVQVAIGELDAELRPFPQLHARRVTLSWPSTTREPVAVDDLMVRIRLLPLLFGDLDLNYISLYIPHYHLPDGKAERSVEDTRIQARLKIEDRHVIVKNASIQTRLDALLLELNTPLARYDGDTLDVERLDLKSGGSHLDIAGKITFSTGAFDFKTNELLIKEDASQQLLKIWKPISKTQLGEIRGAMTAQASSREVTEIHADLSVTKMARGKGLSADTVALKKVQLLIRPGASVKVGGDIYSEGLKITVDKTTYSARKVEGKVEYVSEAEGASRIQAKVALDQMGYTDGRTTISEVVAVVEPAQFSFKPSGDMSLALTIKGTALKLENDSVKVSRAGSIDAPLMISIPAQGGYNVSGPITVRDADIQVANQDLRAVQGTVQMVVAPKEKSFLSKGLQFQAAGKISHLAGNFRMNDTKFTLVSAETDYLDGMLRCSGELSRVRPKPLRVDAMAENLSVQRIRDVIAPDREGKAFGTVQTAQMTMVGAYENFSATVGGGGNVIIVQQEAEKALISRMLFKALQSIPIVSKILDADKGLGTRQVLEATVRFHNGAVHFEPAKLSREGSYTVTATGKLGFDKQLNLKGEVVFLQETLSELALGIGALKKIISRVAKIVVPITATGIAPDIDVSADLSAFLRNNSGLSLGQDILSQIGEVILPSRSYPKTETP